MGQKHFEAIPLTSLLRERDDKRAATLEKCSPAAILNFHVKNAMRLTKHQSTSFTGLYQDQKNLTSSLVPRSQNQVPFSLRTMQ